MPYFMFQCIEVQRPNPKEPTCLKSGDHKDRKDEIFESFKEILHKNANFDITSRAILKNDQELQLKQKFGFELNEFNQIKDWCMKKVFGLSTIIMQEIPF